MKRLNFKKFEAGGITILMILMAFLAVLPTAGADMTYPDQTLTGGFQVGHFDDIWDLTVSPITISFTYDANGLVDDAGAHAWAELGVRTVGKGDFNPVGPVYVCNYDYTTDLIADKDINVGEVHIWNEKDIIYVKYLITSPGCKIKETRLHITNDWTLIPQKKDGKPDTKKFMLKEKHHPEVTEYTYSYDITSLRGQDLYVAAYAKVKIDKKGDKKAWGAGVNFPWKDWATYTPVQPSCTPASGAGVWLATDYDGTPNTFDPDPPGAPTLDLDDKMILQRQGGQGEGAYNLPSVPPVPGNNHRFWWDRDGVDPWQNPETANTGGIYHIVINLTMIDATTGTAYMSIQTLDQGFETDGNWNTIELYPAGMTFTGDMEHLQVFYGLYGYGATHSVTFSNINVVGSTHATIHPRSIPQMEHPFIVWILRTIMQRFQ